MRSFLPLLCFAPILACAQSVSLSGSLGDKALLMIDGTPRTLAAGSTYQNVRLISVTSGSAVIEINGKRATLALGGSQVNLGGTPSEGGATQVVLTAGTGGHFLTTGSINGKSVRFLVDTGATFVSMGASEADRLGINYRNGQQGISQTANGPMTIYRVLLRTVRIGEVQVYDVEAVVGSMPMDFVLLGNSFLNRFQMKRENDSLTLSRRY